MDNQRKQNGGRRRQIVQEFVKNINDDTERMVCFLYMNNYSSAEICKRMKIKPADLKAIKLKLAVDLRKVGIENSE